MTVPIWTTHTDILNQAEYKRILGWNSQYLQFEKKFTELAEEIVRILVSKGCTLDSYSYIYSVSDMKTERLEALWAESNLTHVGNLIYILIWRRDDS